MDLYPILIAMTDWGEKWSASAKGPRILMIDRATGKPIDRVAVRSVTGRIVPAKDVLARPGPGADGKIRELLEKQWRTRRKPNRSTGSG
jgi:hypothetical protein